jgi:PAS domain-containing protein
MTANATPPSPPEVQALLAELSALRERNHLLEAVVAHSAAIIFAKDIEGRLILANDAHAAVFPHIAASGMLGKAPA